ncbi:Chorismate synthase [Gossypium arboreum]|uniref:Chorismate synthase n=1 Tax=Gossypium arboreum TaxID=29729 RepID=A0A0B0NXV2_GOSAR|nr:Chorismate synthase [Gossypium arboreum]
MPAKMRDSGTEYGAWAWRQEARAYGAVDMAVGGVKAEPILPRPTELRLLGASFLQVASICSTATSGRHGSCVFILLYCNFREIRIVTLILLHCNFRETKSCNLQPVALLLRGLRLVFSDLLHWRQDLQSSAYSTTTLGS